MADRAMTTERVEIAPQNNIYTVLILIAVVVLTFATIFISARSMQLGLDNAESVESFRDEMNRITRTVGAPGN